MLSICFTYAYYMLIICLLYGNDILFFFIKIVCERIETYYCQILMCYLCIVTKKKEHNDKAVSLTFL